MSRRSGAIGALYTNPVLLTAATWATSGWALVDNVKDATFNGEVGKADVSARGSVFRQTVPTLIDATIDFSMPWDDDDTDIALFQAAWLARTQIAVAAFSDTIANDGQGPVGNWYVTKFERPEPLEDAMMVNITLSPASFTFWESAAAS